MAPPELHTPDEAARVIERRRVEARDRGEEFVLHLSAEELARAHEERERTTPWLAEPILFPMIERASRLELGYCNATEYTLRGWAWVDTAHLYGEGTFGRFLRAADAAGKIMRERIPRGGRFKNGEQTRGGTTTNRFPSAKERAAQRWKEKLAKRAQRRRNASAQRLIQREPAAPAATPARARAADEPHTALPHIPSESVIRQDFLKPLPSAEPIGVAVEDWEAKKARAIELAGELAKQFAAERDERPPPE